MGEEGKVGERMKTDRAVVELDLCLRNDVMSFLGNSMGCYSQ